MRNLIRLTTLLGLALTLSPMKSALAEAQDLPLEEVGVDYNYVRTNAPPGGCGCFSMNGGDAWIAYNLTGSFAVVAQVASQHASNIGGSGADLTLTSYLFGSRYTWRNAGRLEPFGQVLLGGARASGSFAPGNAGYPGSANAFAMTTGVGLDVGLSKRFAVRAFESDYYLTRFANGVNDHQNNLRLSAGLIFRFGQK
jgi:outer membrane immunogenic protein